MSLLLRQSVWNTLISYAGAGLGVITTVVLYPNILLPEEYGLTRVLLSFSMVGAQFANLGFRGSIIRFMPLLEGFPERREGFIWLSMLASVAGVAIFSLAFLMGQGVVLASYANEPLFLDYRWWILPMTIYIVFYELFNGYLRSRLDSITGTLYNEFGLRISMIVILLMYHFEWIDLDLFVILFTSSYGAVSLALGWILIRRGYFEGMGFGAGQALRRVRSLPGRLRRALTLYGGYTFLGGLTAILIWNIDVLMLSSMAGLEATAVYSIAFYMLSMVSIPLRSMERIGTPLIASFIKRKQWDDLRRIYEKTSLNGAIVSLFVASLIWINIDLILTMMPDSYAGAKWVVLWLAVGRLMDAVAGLNGSVLVNSKHYKADLAGILILLVMVVGSNLALIPLYGAVGAAIATSMTLITYNIMKLIYVAVKMKVHPFGKGFSWVFLWLLPWSLAIALIPLEMTRGMLSPEMPGWVGLAVEGTLKSALLGGVFLISLLRLPVSEDMRLNISRWIGAVAGRTRGRARE